MRSWSLIYIACSLATIVQLGFMFKGFVSPTLLNTSVKEIDLKDIDFPIEIKICATPGFSENAIEEMGYEEGVWNYFKGRSRFNSSIIGWAGHTEDFGVKGTVEEVFNMVRNHKIEDIFKWGGVKFSSGKYQNFSLHQFHLADRVNYPYNCFRLNLTFPNLKGERIKFLEIFFKTNKTKRVQLDFHGSTLIANRDIYDDTFHTSGDAIVAKSQKVNKYAVELSGNSYLEEDDSKNCRNYPNSEYSSYKDCDDQYMRSICERAGLAPVWLWEDFDKVTKKAVVDDSGRQRMISFHNNLT